MPWPHPPHGPGSCTQRGDGYVPQDSVEKDLLTIGRGEEEIEDAEMVKKVLGDALDVTLKELAQSALLIGPKKGAIMIRILSLTLGASCLLALGIILGVGMNRSAEPLREKVITTEKPAKEDVIPAKEPAKAEVPLGLAQSIKDLDVPKEVLPLVPGNMEFAWAIYQKLAEKEGNLVFSPLSISTAFAMVYAGAKGNTAHDLRKTFGFPVNQEKNNEAFFHLLRSLNEEEILKQDYDLEIANSVWLQRGLAINELYPITLRKFFGTDLKVFDAKNLQLTSEEINSWCKEKTKGKFNQLVNPQTLANAQALLFSLVFFKGKWDSPFDVSETKQEPFENLKGIKTQVPMMSYKKTRFFCFFDETAIMAQWPFRNSMFSMYFFLPSKKGMFPSFEKGLSANRFQQMLNKGRWESGDIFFPRFKFKSDLDLLPPLQKLGLTIPFSSAADFSGISNGIFPITSVLHKAVIDVDESGAEASAATSIIVSLSSRRRIVFRADHPFVFAILDNRSQTILFMGRFQNPPEEPTTLP